MPPPKDMGRMFARVMSRRSGSAYMTGSRLADPKRQRTDSPFSISVPPTVIASNAVRPVTCTEESYRSNSSMAVVNDSVLCSKRSWAGLRWSARRPLPIRFTVVSWPAPNRRMMFAVISSFESLLPSSSACTSCGQGEITGVGLVQLRPGERNRIEQPAATPRAGEEQFVVLFRNAEHLADYDDRQTEGKIVDQVHVTLRDRAIECLIYDLLNAWAHILDSSCREGLRHEAAKAGVHRRVLLQHPVPHGAIDRLLEYFFARTPRHPAREVLTEALVTQDEADIRMAAGHIKAERRAVHRIALA